MSEKRIEVKKEDLLDFILLMTILASITIPYLLIFYQIALNFSIQLGMIYIIFFILGVVLGMLTTSNMGFYCYVLNKLINRYFYKDKYDEYDAIFYLANFEGDNLE